MSNKAYNYEFRMLMEGVQVPFNSISIMCTPNGTEANINIFATKEVYNIKPKTSVQVFYRDFVTKSDKPAWRLMCDGSFSSFYKGDQATEGRSVSIICRDFRMDIRNMPAALANIVNDDLNGTRMYYNYTGLYQNFVIQGKPGMVGIRTYSDNPLNSLSEVLKYIAGTAEGARFKDQKDGESNFDSTYGKIVKQDHNNAVDGTARKNVNGKTEAGLFLDTLVRGIFLEAAGGTAAGVFLNKRLRIDKKIVIPTNRAGYWFWHRQSVGLQAASYLMSNSRFCTLETALMKIASLFCVKPYSCSTPTLIPIDNNTAPWIIDNDVKRFLVDRASAEFGGKYTLNQAMFLPPLEFTAPPNCNLIFPPMYDRAVWQYDMENDFTRGNFEIVDFLATPNSSGELFHGRYQIPTALFDIIKKEGNAIDKYKRLKPPLTLEERYKGVHSLEGIVQLEFGESDVSHAAPETIFNDKAVEEIRSRQAELKKRLDDLKNLRSKPRGIINDLGANIDKETAQNIQDELDKKSKELVNIQNSKKTKHKGNYSEALKRHALIKFMNSRFAGRVLTVDMCFNPYIMMGFPSALIYDEESYGDASSKTLIGFIQQVKHFIVITPSGAEASTTVVMNNIRFEDEPTDQDAYGHPLYMRETNPFLSPHSPQIDINTLMYKDLAYNPPDPSAPVSSNDNKKLNDKAYDLANESIVDYKFAKDFVTLTQGEIDSGKRNRNYIDPDYQPNYIAKFYKDILKVNSVSFMVGVTPNISYPNEDIYYMYDTIHEGLYKLRQKNKNLLYHYEDCMDYISRDICTADAFYQGVLGLSVKNIKTEMPGTDLPIKGNNIRYENRTANFEDWRLDEEYFGVTDVDWENGKMDDLKQVNGGLMGEPGQLSSILEHAPYTAFIKERKDAVKNYLIDAQKTVQGVHFASTR